MLRCKKNIPFIVFAIIFALVVAFYAVAYMDSQLSRSVLESYNFIYIFNYVISKQITMKLYGYCILLVAFSFVILFSSDTKSYQSEQMKITDRISTPVKAGQGQCGTAKWLPKDRYDTAFSSIEFDPQMLEKWNNIKLNDIQEELRRIK